MKNKIFLVPYPFTDTSAAKIRPALCLTEPNGDFEEMLLAFITSQDINDPLPSDIEVNPSEEKGASSRLLRTSTVRLHRIFTLNRYKLQREIGVLSPALQEEVAQKLRSLFSL